MQRGLGAAWRSVSQRRPSVRAAAPHALGSYRSKSPATATAVSASTAPSRPWDLSRPSGSCSAAGVPGAFGALGTNSRTSTSPWVPSTPRCRPRCRGLLVPARPRAAHPNDPAPLRRTRRRCQLAPGLPAPGYRRHAQGVSPSSRLDGTARVPGLFHPGHARGVPCPPGPSLLAGSLRLSAPATLVAFAGPRPPPTDGRGPRVDERGAERSPATCVAGGRGPCGRRPGGATHR